MNSLQLPLIFFVVVILLSGVSGVVCAQQDVANTSQPVLQQSAIPVAQITFTNALDSLKQIDEQIQLLQQNNITTLFFTDALLNAQRSFIGHQWSFENLGTAEKNDPYVAYLDDVAKNTPVYEIKLLNYSEVISLVGALKQRVATAYILFDSLTIVERRMQDYAMKGVNITTANETFLRAQKAFHEERYDEAATLISATETALQDALAEYQRTKGIVELGKGFIERYWLHALIVLVVLGIVSVPAARHIRRSLARRKVILLRHELQSIDRLLKQAQISCYRERTITEDTYRIRTERYIARRADVKALIPVYEAIAAGKKPKKTSSLRSDQ